MTIHTKKYVRKALYVDAVQIAEENFAELAEWCQGEIRSNDDEELILTDGNSVDPKGHHIRVRVHNPKNLRQTKGFVGDWILYTERGYKVYTQKAFKASFKPAGPL